MSTRGTIEAFLRDKLGITAIVMLLIYDAMGDVSTLHLLLRLYILVVLAAYTLYENHRHTERVGTVPKFTDLMREVRDHIDNEIRRLNTKRDKSREPFEEPEDDDEEEEVKLIG